jgi:hypothetical protein
MATDPSKTGLARGRHRMVRVVDPRRTNRGAYLSLLVTFVVGLAGFGLWRTWRAAPPPPKWERSLDSKELTWLCAKRHRFQAAAQIGVRACIECGEPAHLIDWYRCPVHGEIEVEVRLTRDWTPTHHSVLIRAGGAFVPADQPIRCTKCNRNIARIMPDPLDTRKPGD